ncbi:conserved Plasmodium protein, unknown function [Plasmodium vivax]|nr:conserved Plasmodium protein, unknown function [Plasmodium vivax]
MAEKEALFHNSINDPYVVNYVWLYGDNMRAAPRAPPEMSPPHVVNVRGEDTYGGGSNGGFFTRGFSHPSQTSPISQTSPLSQFSPISPISPVSKIPSPSARLEKREDAVC